jgi:hypothetical protein
MVSSQEYYILGYSGPTVYFVESQRSFGGTYRFHIHAGILLGLFFDPEDGSDVPPTRRLTFFGLDGIISQNVALSITTAVRISNPTTVSSVSRKIFGMPREHNTTSFQTFLKVRMISALVSFRTILSFTKQRAYVEFFKEML